MRKLTNGELAIAWTDKRVADCAVPTRQDAWMELAMKLANGEKIEDLCLTAGITLEVEE